LHGTTAFFMVAVHDLRLEALANFNARRFRQTIKMDMRLIRGFKEIMNAMVESKTEDEAEKYYVRKIEPLIQKVGRMISFIIALSNLRNKALCPILLKGGKIIPLRELDKVMGSYPVFWVKNVPEDVFEKTYQEIKGTTQTQFLTLYEKACNDFGLSAKNRAVWNRLYEEWVYKAWKIYENEHNKEVKKAGFLV